VHTVTTARSGFTATWLLCFRCSKKMYRSVKISEVFHFSKRSRFRY
jgi:hypothetical protein